jgi:V8-like Glu-specific endopeptidase
MEEGTRQHARVGKESLGRLVRGFRHAARGVRQPAVAVAGGVVLAAGLLIAAYPAWQPTALAADGGSSAAAALTSSASPAQSSSQSPAADSPAQSSSPTTSPTTSPSPSSSPSPSPTPSPSKSPPPGPVGVTFGGISEVGALMMDDNGKEHHFCTATVVQSPAEDLAITAAHCLEGVTFGVSSPLSFAPGYHNGVYPYGQWNVMREYVDSSWQKNENPNDDVAFIIIGKPGHKIQKITGGEILETYSKLPQTVRVIGYPNGKGYPITCTQPARLFDPPGLKQLVFDCGGYTDGTSGGPFLAHVNSKGVGDLIGVIGGYERGGDLPNVSYSSEFLYNVASLYKKATS